MTKPNLRQYTLTFWVLLAIAAVSPLALFVWALHLPADDNSYELLWNSALAAFAWATLPLFAALLASWEAGRLHATATASDRKAIAARALRGVCGRPLAIFALFTAIGCLPLFTAYYVYGSAKGLDGLPAAITIFVSVECTVVVVAFFLGRFFPRKEGRQLSTDAI